MSAFVLLVAAGVVFGWPSLVNILHRERVFAEECHGDVEKNWCNAATIKYNTIFSVGCFASTGAAIVQRGSKL
jgi:hypothetical protein